jgi:predicted nucleotide-binding protein
MPYLGRDVAPRNQGKDSAAEDNPVMTVQRSELEADIDAQLDEGQSLLGRPSVNDSEQLEQLRGDFETWDEFNVRLLRRSFSTGKISDEYRMAIYVSGGRNIAEKTRLVQRDIAGQVRKLQSIRRQLPLFESSAEDGKNTLGQERAVISKGVLVPNRIFIGHGRSASWRELKDFIKDRLGLDFEEFNRVSVAGVGTTERLAMMLDNSSMAFLVCTAEDDHADGSQHARENVVHEAGLFQGRLGFKRAIALLEEGCSEFSNITGLGQIRFPAGNISACFEQVRQVLEREGLIPSV